MKTSATRFSDSVEEYIKYRPGYPQQVIEILKEEIDLNPRSIIADIGSGTGISSALFVNNGNKVLAVEPNREMREAAELIYLNNSNFTSINGTAQQTSLPQHSIDIIFCAQAFHWFNTTETKIEFSRILQPNGDMVFVWNVRKDENDFQKDYETILRHIPEYNKVTHKNISDEDISDFFAPKRIHKKNSC
ncbi:class I SAM-dependent methyltransferase [Ginsengibacter hankyongi]|uniref:Class I SAM-dependent methyltransferase n=1 Tax=Ginsengibacter hankyongi TaxID=2607284 RepID=A0A5J5IDI4_9BACT|nr:class I SAM-dependent methyltransferase [Ginsengibacter hankyongi]KAA9035890.1 class I SAM-dependent methyltransferase [Ginsengibacter hankyongi]